MQTINISADVCASNHLQYQFLLHEIVKISMLSSKLQFMQLIAN